MKKLPILLSCLALLNLGATPAFAAAKAKPAAQTQKPAQPATKSLGKFGNWSSYVVYEGKNPVCYMALTARPKDPKGKREAVSLMVTHRPAESSTDVVSYAAGLKLKAGEDVEARIGDKTFNLFTKDDTAWARDAMTDRAVVMAMRTANTQMVLKGVAADGKPITDTVDLKGARDAYAAASKACGLAAEKPAAAAVAKPAAKQQVKKPAAPSAPVVAKPKKAEVKSKASAKSAHEKKER